MNRKVEPSGVDHRGAERSRGTHPRVEATLDRVGVALGIGALAWIGVTAALAGGSPGATGSLVAAMGGALVAARITGVRNRLLVPAVVLSIVVAVFAWGPLTGRFTDPLDPLEYENASAALALQGIVAGLMLAMSGSGTRRRGLAFGFVAALAIVPFYLGSYAAVILTGLIGALLALVARTGRVRAAILALGTSFVVVLGVTAALGATYEDGAGPLDRLAASALSGRRLELWSDAIVIMAEHPSTGVGPGRFSSVSAVAARDADTREAHNEFLQQGAETGLIGLGLAVLLFLWGFARLFVVPAADTITYLGAAGLAALGIQAAVDYTMHFPLVPIAAALLVGAAQARSGAAEVMGEPSVRDDATVREEDSGT